jgi:hypothetical protein
MAVANTVAIILCDIFPFGNLAIINENKLQYTTPSTSLDLWFYGSRLLSWLPPMHQSGDHSASATKRQFVTKSFVRSQTSNVWKKTLSLAPFDTFGKMLTSTDP